MCLNKLKKQICPYCRKKFILYKCSSSAPASTGTFPESLKETYKAYEKLIRRERKRKKKKEKKRVKRDKKQVKKIQEINNQLMFKMD